MTETDVQSLNRLLIKLNSLREDYKNFNDNKGNLDFYYQRLDHRFLLPSELKEKLSGTIDSYYSSRIRTLEKYIRDIKLEMEPIKEGEINGL